MIKVTRAEEELLALLLFLYDPNTVDNFYSSQQLAEAGNKPLGQMERTLNNLTKKGYLRRFSTDDGNWVYTLGKEIPAVRGEYRLSLGREGLSQSKKEEYYKKILSPLEKGLLKYLYYQQERPITSSELLTFFSPSYSPEEIEKALQELDNNRYIAHRRGGYSIGLKGVQKLGSSGGLEEL